MVKISKQESTVTFKIQGLHKIWAFQSKIIVNKEDIINVYQNPDEIKFFKGIRVGTEIPGIITAGRFYWKGITNFWDMCNKKKTIIVALKNNRFNKLYIEVENPDEMIAFLKN